MRTRLSSVVLIHRMAGGPVEHPWLYETPFIVPSTVIQLDLFSVF